MPQTPFNTSRESNFPAAADTQRSVCDGVHKTPRCPTDIGGNLREPSFWRDYFCRSKDSLCRLAASPSSATESALHHVSATPSFMSLALFLPFCNRKRQKVMKIHFFTPPLF